MYLEASATTSLVSLHIKTSSLLGNSDGGGNEDNDVHPAVIGRGHGELDRCVRCILYVY